MKRFGLWCPAENSVGMVPTEHATFRIVVPSRELTQRKLACKFIASTMLSEMLASSRPARHPGPMRGSKCAPGMLASVSADAWRIEDAWLQPRVAAALSDRTNALERDVGLLRQETKAAQLACAAAVEQAASCMQELAAVKETLRTLQTPRTHDTEASDGDGHNPHSSVEWQMV